MKEPLENISKHPILNFLHKLEDGLLVFIFLIMMGLSVVQILLRNLFDGGIIWGNDVTGLTDNNFNGSVMISNSIIQFPPVGYPNTLQSDPLFKNPANGDYHIKFGSPAVDHFNSVLMVDFEGDSRPQGLLDDAGADEWTDLIFKNSFEQD